jgi:hypothetical protein
MVNVMTNSSDVKAAARRPHGTSIFHAAQLILNYIWRAVPNDVVLIHLSFKCVINCYLCTDVLYFN